MRIGICMKQVLDSNTQLVVRGTSITQKGPKPVVIVNPPDLAALGVAMRLKDRFDASEVVAISYGGPDDLISLLWALAWGADQVIHIVQHSKGPQVDELPVALALSAVLEELHCDVVLCGHKRMGASKVGPIIAEFLELPQVTGVIGLEIDTDQKNARAIRWLEGGWREVIQCSLPALFAVESSIEEPRYLSVHALRRAQQHLTERIDSRFSNTYSKAKAYREALLRFVRMGPPRPRPSYSYTLESGLSPEERLLRILSGGSLPQERGTIHEDSTEKMINYVIGLLKREGFS